MHWYIRNRPLPKSMPKQEREALVAVLKEVLRTAKMENTDFDGGLHTEFTPSDVTGYIREVTNLWRQSWIIKPLEELVKRYE